MVVMKKKHEANNLTMNVQRFFKNGNVNSIIKIIELDQ